MSDPTYDKDAVTRVVEKAYRDQVERGHTLRIYPMWDREGLVRVRVNIHDDNWYVKNSYFIMVETRDVEEPRIVA